MSLENVCSILLSRTSTPQKIANILFSRTHRTFTKPYHLHQPGILKGEII